MPKLSSVTATIANGASLSAEIDLTEYDVAAIQMPAAWTAADLSFQAATSSGGTFQDVYNDADAELVCQAAQGRCIVPTDALLRALSGLRFVKVRSGVTGAAVNQGAARSVVFILKKRK